MGLYEIKVVGKNKRKSIKYEIDINGCWNCTSHSKNYRGYPMIRINNKTLIMSRYLYQIKFGQIQKGLVIRHKCDNPVCINLEHLETGTIQENMTDMVERNRSLKGEKSKRSKLTQLQVNEIRKDTRTHIAISKQYGVSYQQVGRIKHMESWRG